MRSAHSLAQLVMMAQPTTVAVLVSGQMRTAAHCNATFAQHVIVANPGFHFEIYAYLTADADDDGTLLTAAAVCARVNCPRLRARPPAGARSSPTPARALHRTPAHAPAQETFAFREAGGELVETSTSTNAARDAEIKRVLQGVGLPAELEDHTPAGKLTFNAVRMFHGMACCIPRWRLAVCRCVARRVSSGVTGRLYTSI